VPWGDDYDIIILDRDRAKIERQVYPKLKAYGFTIKNMGKGGMHVYSALGAKYFQCDIFYSWINRRRFVKNISTNGRYTKKNVPWVIVAPAQHLTIDNDLTLPFFADYKRDVEIEYNNVIDECVFHIRHRPAFTIKAHFSRVYAAFESIKADAIARTQALVNTGVDAGANDNHITLPVCTFESSLSFLQHLRETQANIIWFFDPAYLPFCLDTAVYLPGICMNFCMLEPVPSQYLCFLLYATQVFYRSREQVDRMLHKTGAIFERHMPAFVPARVITFGTFDLFHAGHQNILARAREYGDHLTVGVSSDALNLSKGKTSVKTLEQRILDIQATHLADDIFVEESLEDKDIYITEQKATVLVMGDDWQGKFDHVPCACVYLPRTPGISTTLLKKEKVEAP
jgi:glycerol-3-phosphate cytidylyltransferase